jgi:hypothetical protein
MPEIRTLVLYGNSLVVSSVGASLQARAGLQVVPLDAALPGVAGQLSALQPDIIIFDLAAAQPDFAITLWKARSQTLLIGVDLVMGRALVLSGQASRALTTDDLLQAIDSHADRLKQENAEVTAHVSLRPRRKRRGR